MNQNGLIENVTNLLTSALVMSGALAIGEEMDGSDGEAIFALRELNLLVARYNQNNLMQFEKQTITTNITESKISYTIGSGSGYVSDRVTLDDILGDTLIFDRDVVAGELIVGQTVKVYSENSSLITECLLIDVGPNFAQIDNLSTNRLDVNTRYVLFNDSMDIPDIPCVTPDNIKNIVNQVNDTNYVIDSGTINDSVEFVTAIPRVFQYVKGALGLIIFDCKAQTDSYTVNALSGIKKLTLSSVLNLPSPLYIDLLQTALAIRLGKMYGRDVSVWMNDLAKLENSVQMLNVKNLNLEDRGRRRFDLASYRYV